MTIKESLCGFLVFAAVFFLSSTVRCEPLFQSSRSPLMLMVLTPEPQSPLIPEGRVSVSLSADYSTVFVNRSDARWTALVDMELAVVTPAVEIPLGERFSLSASLPLVHMTDGVFDGPLEDYHDWGNFPDYGRKYRPHNEFAYEVTKDGLPWFSADKNGIHVADSRMSLKYLFYADLNRAFSLQYTIKLPTGDADSGYGSGHVDHGFFLLNRFAWGKAVYFLNPGLVLPQDPETLGADVEFKTMACLFAGGEYMVNERWGLNAQFNMFQSPITDSSIPHLDNACIELAMGVSYRTRSGLRWEMSFTEDLSGPSSDFTLRTGVRF